MPKTDCTALSLKEWKDTLAFLGQPAYRAAQVYQWLHKERAKSFDQMSNLPLALRQRLQETFYIPCVQVAQMLCSQQDETVKFLFSLEDGALIEGVLMQYAYGNTLCLSTQVGCNMGCVFCASTLSGKQRDLTCGEMLGQIDAATMATGRAINHLVLMGMGEPLDNFEQVTAFLDRVSDPDGRQISARHITLSTCGLVPQIRALAEQKRQITLTVSLHATNDTTRSALMPVNRVYSMGQLKEALVDYFAKTGRRVSLEYTLIRGQNDSSAHAKELAAFIGDFPCHVNLIPVNPVPERGLLPPTPKEVKAFVQALEQAKIPATVRRTLGQDISAACGQLRRRATQGEA